MKHFTPAASHLRAAIPVVGMATLLEERKATLEGMIRERFRQARECGATVDVKQLSASLRAVKRSLQAASSGRNAA
jgi:uncharacterized protein (UPF0335 family)